VKVVALAGGVGGAKLADGIAKIIPADNFSIIVNTGDDFDHLGLRICPDLDTVCYTLSGLANPITGWGRADETWNVWESINLLGGPDWFRLGDHDLGTHLVRTHQLQRGKLLSEITHDFCRIWNIGPAIYPMSDSKIPTIVLTDEGELPFQEYFVRRECLPLVKGFRFDGVELAAPPQDAIVAIREADLMVICPSNPLVSIDPILSVPYIREEILARSSSSKSPLRVVAVSPIIGGKAVKGPVAKMYRELGMDPSALTVAKHYGNLIQGFVFDLVDSHLEKDIKHLGLHTLITETLMSNLFDRKRLAEKMIEFFRQIVSG
jgi:LPPG:FO 2-phospho-L-lactate transferase